MLGKDRRGKARSAAGAIRRGGAGTGGAGRSGPGTVAEYAQLAESARRPRPLARNAAAAFLVGGLICAAGQGALAYWLSRGFAKDLAVGLTAATMVVLSAVLTGLGIYDAIGQFGGMGSAIPITGFANSIVSPALESKREGFILGVGAKMFTIAGPVIVYGLLTAVVMAVLRMALRT